MQHDDELNAILMKRASAPATPGGLAERIIHAALTQERANKRRLVGFIDDLMAMIVIPHPSVAVAAGIILGLMMGVQASDGLSMFQQDWSSFLFVNEGGWL